MFPMNRIAPLLVAALATLATLAAACGDPTVVRIRVPDEAPPDDEGLPEPEATQADLEQHGTQAVDEIDVIDVIDDPPAEEPAPEEPPPDEPVDEPTVPADCTQVRVTNTGGVVLNIRPDPSTVHAAVGSLDPGETVDVIDVVSGQTVNGVSTWYEIDDGSVTGFVSGAFTSCVDPNAPPPPPSGFLLPLQCGTSARVTQGNNSSFSHNGGSAYAFDFGLALNTPLVAVQAGRVIAVNTSTQPGDPCYSGGGSSCIDKGNYVTIDHGDGSNSLYAHINSTTLHVGDWVERGQVVAKSGGTGYSTGPHAHVQRQRDCGIWWCQSIEMKFADVGGDHIPETGDTVTSQNCP
jgi:hypothetical protein